jgi:hypothetical protein
MKPVVPEAHGIRGTLISRTYKKPPNVYIPKNLDESHRQLTGQY